MVKHSPLDDPEQASFAWARYWRLMRWMALFSIFVTIVALTIFWWVEGFVSIHFFIATAGAVSVSIMLMAALMGLVFLSSGTGHDEAIDDPFADQDQP
jgi:magnesium-transporting ATPase (P-type)